MQVIRCTAMLSLVIALSACGSDQESEPLIKKDLNFYKSECEKSGMKLGSAQVFYRQNEQVAVDARCMALDITSTQVQTDD